MNHSELVQRFTNGKTHGNASHMYIDGDVLYSYGSHFPMLVRRPYGYLLNADKYSVTTTQHQGHCRHVATIQIPFSALQSAQIDYLSFDLIDKSDERIDYLGTYKNYNDKKIPAIGKSEYEALTDKDGWYELTERRPEHCVIEYRGIHYLSGMDGQNYFLCQLPKLVKTVDEAIDSLKPLNLPSEHIRQGEWFFIKSSLSDFADRWDIEKSPLFKDVKKPFKDINDFYKYIYNRMEHDFILPRTNTDSHIHKATRGMLCNGFLFVSGRVTHTEHNTAHLSKSDSPIVYKAIMNNAVHSWSASGYVD